MKMKRLMLLVAALPVLFLAGCKKEKVDPLKPSVTWETNSGFDTKEMTPALDAKVTVTAPGQFQELTLELGLGQYYNMLANPYISIASNKGTPTKSPVMDVINDESTVSFLRGLGLTAGSALPNRDQVVLDLKKILEAVLEGQLIDNNSSFTIGINVKDKTGGTISKTARFHFTAAPSFNWKANSTFAVVDLEADPIDCKVEILAPGKIEALTVKLEDGADSKVVEKVKSRTTDGGTLIDLITDSKAAKGFNGYFPAAKDISGKDRAVLDFGFMYDWLFDMSSAPSTNIFTVKVVDQNGKETVQKVRFGKN